MHSLISGVQTKSTRPFKIKVSYNCILPSFVFSVLSESGFRAGDCFDNFVFLSFFPVPCRTSKKKKKKSQITNITLDSLHFLKTFPSILGGFQQVKEKIIYNTTAEKLSQEDFFTM